GHSFDQIFLLGSSLGSHCFDCFELVAAYEIHAREHPFELIAQPRLDLGLDPRQRPEGARGNAREIVEKSVLALHPEASIGSPGRMPNMGPRYHIGHAKGKSFTPDRARPFPW